MITTFFRSSSINSWSYCQAKYMLTYVLGNEEKMVSSKADLGTAMHKVLEVLAIIQYYFQDNNEQSYSYIDEHLGEINVTREEFYSKSVLSDEDITKINKSRKSKTVYLYPCLLERGHVRMGARFVNSIILKSFNHYKARSDFEFTQANFKQVFNWTYMTLESSQGIYDPRNRKIKDPERQFNFEIDEPWAEYSFPYGDTILEGKLALKGTIDLVTELDSETAEIVDYKSGRRLNWSTGKEKNLDDFYNDIQLQVYYLAARTIYPEYKNILLTINYVRDGGPHTIYFEDEDLPKIKDRIRKLFEEIKNTENPKLRDESFSSFQCNKLCSYFKDKVDGKPLCLRNKERIEELGIDTVSVYDKKPNFQIGFYSAPGGE